MQLRSFVRFLGEMFQWTRDQLIFVSPRAAVSQWLAFRALASSARQRCGSGAAAARRVAPGQVTREAQSPESLPATRPDLTRPDEVVRKRSIKHAPLCVFVCGEGRGGEGLPSRVSGGMCRKTGLY